MSGVWVGRENRWRSFTTIEQQDAVLLALSVDLELAKSVAGKAAVLPPAERKKVWLLIAKWV